MRYAAWVGALLMALALGGCALPPVMVVASYSADIVSYAATGKTVTDHAYSAVARSDCSFIRVLREKPICVDYPSDKTNMIAAATPTALVAAPAAVANEPASGTPRNLYVAIGSFRDSANAQRTVERYAAFHAQARSVVVHGEPFNRVVAGPLTQAEASALKEKMIAAATPSRRIARG